MRKLWLLGALGLTLLCAQPTWAQATDDASRAAARDMGYSGVEAYERGDYPTALDKLGRAYRILRVPTLGLWLARALEKSGKLVEAAERYLEVTRMDAGGSDAAVHRKAQSEAEAERATLLPRVPSLVMTVADGNETELDVKVDGVPVSSAFLGEKRLVNPGRHDVVATRGSQRFSATVSVREGESKALVLDFGSGSGQAPSSAKPEGTAVSSTSPAVDGSPPPAESGGTKTLAWASIVAGGVGIVVGGTAGFLAMNKRSSLDCPEDSCTNEKQDDVDTYNTLRTVSTVGFVAGAVLGATGGVLLLTGGNSKASGKAGVAPLIGLNRLGMGGRF